MDFTSRSTEKALPPLLTLPVELKLEIISHLPHDEYPSRACLRRTHSSFLQLIPKADIRSKLSDTELSNQLLKTEMEYAYLFPPDHYPCYMCARVLPLGAFDDSISDPHAHYRSCQQCRMLKRSSYRRSFIESIIWIGCTCEKLPMPPLRPRLRPRSATTVRLMTNELMQHLQDLKQQALDCGTISKENRGLDGAEEVGATSVLDSHV